MALATVASRALLGIGAPAISVEVNLSGGLPRLAISGMPETAVKESKDRVRAALGNAGFQIPARVITVSLAPADLPKEGSRFDLPIALGILVASGQLPASCIEGHEFVGELSLSGALRPVPGMVPALVESEQAGHRLVAPLGNRADARVMPQAGARFAADLLSLCAWLRGEGELPGPPEAGDVEPAYPDLSEVQGQQLARRALEIAAAGNHHLLMSGPPGTGKSMLAMRLAGILPPLDDARALEVACIHSCAAGPRGTARVLAPGLWRQRPFRDPHHTASAVALVGGGARPRPGEISLAHHGILFLDELPEFSRQSLEVLREPLESGQAVISRAGYQAVFPARFQLVAAMNPCPCGYLGDPAHECRCSASQVLAYRQRISGPLLDRFDLKVELPRIKVTPWQLGGDGECSEVVRKRVSAAQQRQLERSGMLNARLDLATVAEHCRPVKAARELLRQAMERLHLSPRGSHRLLRVARTIADLENAERIGQGHVAEAVSFRRLATN